MKSNGEMRGLLMRGSALRAGLLLANVVVAFFMMPFVIHAIGDRWYGMWTLVATIIEYFGYLDFGLSVATQRFIAAALGRNDRKEVNQLVTTSFAVFGVLGAIGFVAAGVIALGASWFLTNPVEVTTFRIVLLLLGLNIGFTLSMAPINGLMTGHLRYDVSTSINFIKLVVRTALIVYVIRAGYGIVALALTTLSMDVGANLAKLVIARRMFPQVTTAAAFFDRKVLPQLWSYGAKTFVQQLAELLKFKVQSIVIAGFINLSAVTLFNIAGQLVAYFRDFMAAVVGILTPVFARYEAAGDILGLQRAYYFTSKLAAATAIVFGGAAVVFGKPFINLWMGPAYSEAYPVMAILIVSTTLYVAQFPGYTVIFGLGAVGPLAKASLLDAAVNLIISISLVSSYGLRGVALGTAVPLMFYSIFILVFAGRLVGGTVGRYTRAILPIVGWGVPLQTAAWYAVGNFSISSYVELVALAAVALFVQVPVLLFAAFSADEISIIRDSGLRALGISRV